MCKVGFESLDFVGHKICMEQIGLQDDNMISDAPVPQTTTSFSGLSGFYSEDIPNYLMVAVPLTDLMKKGIT